MKKSEIGKFHTELITAIKAVAAKYNMVIEPSNLRYGTAEDNISDFRVQIKGLYDKPVEEVTGSSDKDVIQNGWAKPNTKAAVYDKGQLRDVIIVSSKRTKYVFYFADDQEKKHMIGPFKAFVPSKNI